MSRYEVVIVGGGVFGLSSAVQLARANYKVIVIDKFPIPSPLSAANDYNKIVRLEYNDMVYAELAVEAMGYWNGEDSSLLPARLLHDCYSHCGRISVVQDPKTRRYAFDESSLRLLQDKFSRCRDVKEFKDLTCGGKFPQLSDGQRYDIFRYNPDCGIGFARESLLKMKRYAESLGVVFQENDGVVEVEKFRDGSQSVVVRCESGKRIHGKKVVIACGANTSAILPMQRYVKATGLYVGHVQLSDEEYQKFKDIPVIFNSSVGYIFPPDAQTKMIKICTSAMSAYDGKSNGSYPVYRTLEPHTAPSIPISAAVRIRTVLGKYLPSLVFTSGTQSQLRDIIDCKICWVSDTANSDFIIDEVPGMSNVYVCCGDSGHAYKFLPNIGKYIQQKLENKLPEPLARKWSFREANWNDAEIEWRVEPTKLAIQDVEWFKESYGHAKL